MITIEQGEHYGDIEVRLSEGFGHIVLSQDGQDDGTSSILTDSKAKTRELIKALLELSLSDVTDNEFTPDNAENELVIGDRRYRAKEAKRCCAGCAFYADGLCVRPYQAEGYISCLATVRKDQRSIIWAEVQDVRED